MSLNLVCEQLLTANHLNQQHLSGLLEQLAQRRIDYADLYFQTTCHESWSLENGIIKEGSWSLHQGVGVRAVSGEKTGFAYADQITLPALRQSVEAARGIVREQGNGRIHTLAARQTPPLYPAIDPLQSLNRQQKLDLLRQIDHTARAADQRVQEVNASLNGVYELILIAASDGTLAADIRPLVRLSVSVLLEENGKREHGSSGGGGRFGYQWFQEPAPANIQYFTEQPAQPPLHQQTRADAMALEAVRIAQTNLHARPAPAGTMPVILGPGWPGVLLHEAVGHGLEGDFNRRGSSVFSGQIGQQVASPLCTVVDDGTLNARRGSLAIDDEGVAGQCTVLIKNGVLCGYMQDKLNARLMNMQPTGNGRRESYAHLPMPRMTNTCLLAGESRPQDIIASVERGIYAPGFAGGQVDITSGKFVFSMSEAYLIENGTIGQPIKGATLIGAGREVMQKVSMVGNDLHTDPGIGICGKNGQSVPVGVGQPTVKIDGMTVGGAG